MAETEREGAEAAQRAYWLALGRFVDEFAHIEALLYDTLAQLAAVSDGTAAAIFSGVRIQDAMSFITKIAAERHLPDSSLHEFSYAFSQLGKINQTRNFILHYGATISADVIVVGDFRLAPLGDRNRANWEVISPGTLDDMTTDLQKIQVHLLFAMQEVPLEGRQPSAAMANSAWRYRQQRQGRRRRPHQSSI